MTMRVMTVARVRHFPGTQTAYLIGKSFTISDALAFYGSMFLHIAALKLILQQINMHFSLAILAATVAAANGAFKEGDECGVTAADFVNVDFSADYLVAGEEGCTIDGKTQCYCAPNLTDGESQGTFQWQCGGTVNFGPVEGKECPATVPVPKNSDILGLVPKQVSENLYEWNSMSHL